MACIVCALQVTIIYVVLKSVTCLNYVVLSFIVKVLSRLLFQNDPWIMQKRVQVL
jgi:flagellar biosynthesis protein FliQ